jgi:signal transduction histidine kinase
MTNGLSSGENKRILVVDDNPSIHADVRKILVPPVQKDASLAADMEMLFDEKIAEEGSVAFQIDSAFQGQEGLAKVIEARDAGRPYALAFVDVRMPPGWDGVETIQHLWRAEPNLQVVICTAYSDYSWGEMVRQIGWSDSLVILKKPFDNIEVLQLAHAMTKKWRLNQDVKNRLHDLEHLVNQRTSEIQSANQRLQVANDKLKKEMEERARMENQLRQIQKMDAVGQLAAGVAHDFNNILTVIEGNVSLLMETKAPGTEDWICLEAVTTSSHRAAKLVRQLLAFSRKQFMQPQPLNVSATLSSLSEMLTRGLGEQITVKINVADDLPPIIADANMIEQSLMNLAVNARDAMPGGGLLTISADFWDLSEEKAARHPEARPGHYVRIRVSDAGTGMPPEVLQRLFEPFFTTKAVGKGTGLGLATVYGIAKQHDGWVEVESEPGKGSTFSIFIPSAGNDADNAASPSRSLNFLAPVEQAPVACTAGSP